VDQDEGRRGSSTMADACVWWNGASAWRGCSDNRWRGGVLVSVFFLIFFLFF
jgi:hypothetical protein